MKPNIAASVRARLANKAKADGRPFQEVLQYYGLERFLYRISKSEHSDSFILKGALMLSVWKAPESRPTRDIDLLGYGENSVAILESTIRDACATEVEDDGLRFDASTVEGARIKEDAEYEGVRIKFMGLLEKARIQMQIDVGFGDVVYPEATEAAYPTLLDSPPPLIRIYPPETVVAEKFQAMVFLGSLNSRMKDFFDLWLLSQQFEFNGLDLAEAVRRTFENRGTEIDTNPVALTSAFTASDASQKQSAGFLKRSNITSAPTVLDEIRESLRQFLLPVASAVEEGAAFNAKWHRASWS